MFTKFSALFKINSLDVIKGLITAFFGAIAGFIWPIIESGSFVIDWQTALKAGLVAAVGYLCKQFFTNSDGQFMKKEQ